MECEAVIGDGSSHELTGATDVGMQAVLIRVPYEDAYDVYRPDVDEWQGPMVASLTEVLTFLGTAASGTGLESR